MEANTQPNQPTPNPSTPNPGNPDINVKPDTEVDPAKVGNETEVDLDKEKVKTYPKTNPPERH